jgi:hypothetical protein
MRYNQVVRVFRIILLTLICLLSMLLSVKSAQAENVTAKTLLAALPVRAESSMTGYSRDKFPHWIDADSDGCDTRKEVLQRQRLQGTLVGCLVTGGRWYSAYDGLYFTNPSSLDIDHVIALAESWRSGSNLWTTDTRKRFANDLSYTRSLIAVSASSNRSKGDKDPSAWLPPRAAYKCKYVTNWVAVKYRWSLKINTTEKTAIQNALNGCSTSAITLPRPPRATIALA